MFKVGNKDTRPNGAFIVTFEYIGHLSLVFLLLTLKMYLFIEEPGFQLLFCLLVFL